MMVLLDRIAGFYLPVLRIKNHGIELRDAAGDDLDFPLLGLPEESDWALIAPFNDKTLMRDALAHAYASAALPWSPRTRVKLS
ncbi:MAG: hypothetical protein R2795_25830 [Saprospiraceae bacterium]